MLDLDAGQPANILRLVFGPLRPHIEDWPALAASLLARARRESIGAVADPELQSLIDELTSQVPAIPLPTIARSPIIDVAFRIDGAVQRYFSTVTTLGTALDVDLQELRIELFHPRT